MGNTTSETVKKFDPNVPLKSALKKPTGYSPPNGHQYYPTSYPPEPYFYPAHPTYNPVDSNQNHFHAHSPTKITISEPYSPRHSIQDTNSYHHQHHHHHTAHDHHHHHHHHRHHNHRRSQQFSEKENFNLPIDEERPISSHLPSVPAQKSVSSVVTRFIKSPVANKEFIASPSPLHHSSSMTVKKTSSPTLTENPLSPVVVKQNQTPQRSLSNATHPSLLIQPNSFEKAPAIGTNYIAKPPDNHPLHSYASGPLTIVQRSPLRHIAPGNRWYDHDYDKRVKSLIPNEV